MNGMKNNRMQRNNLRFKNGKQVHHINP